MSGPEDHAKIQAELKKIGLMPMVIRKREEFIFGDAKTAVSDCAFLYPAFLNGKFVSCIDIARVPVACPGLFSLKMAKKWDCMTDHGKQELVVQKHKCRIPFENGTPTVNILDFDPGTVDLSEIPDEMFISGRNPHSRT